jgi:heme/copper-type cytochrome/quinol oxidase subunit 2
VKKIHKLGFYAFILVIAMILAPNVILKVLAEGTSINVQPEESTVLGTGLEFQVNITVSEVANLGAWDVQLYFPNSLLSAINVSEGPFLEQAGSTLFLPINATNSYNATDGEVRAADTLTGNVTGANGSGTLATITFEALSGGDGNLTFGETELQAQVYPDFPVIPCKTNGGTFLIEAERPNVAIANVLPSKTVLGWNCPLRTIVTVKNVGTYSVRFNVTLYAQTLLFSIANIHLYGADHGLNNGWGLSTSVITSPGPTLTVQQGTLVNLTLTSVDDKTHNFFIDYYGNQTPTAGDPKSPDFPSEGPPYLPTINYQFTADRLGTFKYYCQYDEEIMNGTFIVVPTPTKTITIGSQSLNLKGGASCNFTYVWNATCAHRQSYLNLTACICLPLGETNSANNNFTCSKIEVTIPGDINGDGVVNLRDLTVLALNWLKTVPPAPENADISGVGIINLRDLTVLALNWLKRV